MQRLIILVIFSSFVTLSGCIFPGVYKRDLQQGHMITEEMVQQLQTGQTQAQVRYIMGSPLTPSTLNANRWDYIYWQKDPRDNVSKRIVSLYFHQNVLIRIEAE